MIYHYDIAITPDKPFPPRFTHQLIKQLQHDTAPQVFLPAGAYDGKKNLFMPHRLNFGKGQDSATFNVAIPSENPSRPPLVYTIKVTKVAEINPEVIERFVTGKQSQDETVLTALTAMNVIIRQDPISRYTFNVRSFFTGTEIKAVGQGIELWRGYFQSIRPTIGRVILNVDIATGLCYLRGPLINLALEFFQKTDPNVLAPSRGLPDAQRLRLQRFISGIRVRVKPAKANLPTRIVSIQKLSREGARDYRFPLREGGEMTVADYFHRTSNRPLDFPLVMCGLTPKGVAIPLERCEVLPGQLMRKQIPEGLEQPMLEFSQKRPQDRLQSIREGLQTLSHGQSEYVRNFGMTVKSQTLPMEIDARVLMHPKLQYGAGSKQPTVEPRDGQWNLRDKKFVEPRSISRWAITLFVPPSAFPPPQVNAMVEQIISAFAAVGMAIAERDPVIKYMNPQRDLSQELRSAGMACVQKNGGGGKGPDILFVVLPALGNKEIYRGVKHFGDCEMGVPTQCLKLDKCRRANIQYWANISLKVNPKLGGTNSKPDPRSAAVLTDPHTPTIIMGADVMHPAPGSSSPSFAALVSSIDSDASKYISEIRVQTARQEIIADLYTMAKNLLGKYMTYQRGVEKKAKFTPTRLIFFRDGVSEGQYRQVKDQELQVLREVCQELKINPKITFLIVAKRHHFRFFPPRGGEADRSGNCPAGTVVDSGITHPVEFDFYLQSHGGLLGTSRSAHYHILHDDSAFTPDAMQAMCFTLCHVFARATKSISIPAPVAYADLVCARAPNHYKSSMASDLGSQTSGGTNNLLRMQADFKPLHANQERVTFFT